MLLEIIAALILLVVTITSAVALKTMNEADSIVENALFGLKDSIFEWFKTEEGLVFVADLGKLFAAGAMTQLKMPKQDGNVKIFGYKVPQQVISAVLNKFLGGQSG